MGLLERIRRRGDDSPAAAPAEGDPSTAWAPPPTEVAHPDPGASDPLGAGDVASAGPAEAPTTVQPVTPGLWQDAQAGAPAPGAVPAGAEPADPLRATRPSFQDRGRLRRRLRYLRRVRELGFRDLGGLVFDQHRFGARRQDLVEGKLQALLAVDRELRALERALGDRREFIDLREPGIAACPRCSALHGSDARFCPSCGLRLSGPRAFAEVAEGPQVVDPASGVVHPPPPPPPEPEMAAPVEPPTQVLVAQPPEPGEPTERMAAVDPTRGHEEQGAAPGEAPTSATAAVTPAGPDTPAGDSADPLPEDDRADARRKA